MASIITKDYFQYNPNKIPNLQSNVGEDSTVYDENIAELTNTINRYEKEYLILLLGQELYAEYITTITDAKWNALKALLYNDTDKVSQIANYIYCGHLIENSNSYNGRTVTITKQENSYEAAPDVLIVISWNAMVKMNAPIFTYLENTTIETTAVLDNAGWEVIGNYRNRFL